MYLDYLINYLLKERGKKTDLSKLNYYEKEILYRSLVNTRPPKEIDDEFLKIEDEYLQDRLAKLDITDFDALKIKKKVVLWQGDITRLKIDAIVNPGNEDGIGCFVPNHNCLDNQINTFAGVRLRLACNEKMKEIKKLKTGSAIITKAYNLPCKYVIETCGPIVSGKVTDQNIDDLDDCYANCLKLASENKIKEVAFPCISTGLFHFPKDLAAQVAINAARVYLRSHKEITKVVFALYTKEDMDIYEQYI